MRVCLLCYRTFLTGRPDPAVSAAAAAVAGVALGSVFTLAGFGAIWPVKVLCAVWRQRAKRDGNDTNAEEEQLLFEVPAQARSRWLHLPHLRRL